MDELFKKWTEVSDAYRKLYLRWQSGDASARQEAWSLAKQLQTLNEQLRSNRGSTREPMRSGVYAVSLLQGATPLGAATVLIKGRTLVGADGVHFYRGEITHEGAAVDVLMEVTRHNFAIASAFNQQALFTLKWQGTIDDDQSFTIECMPLGARTAIQAKARWLAEQ